MITKAEQKPHEFIETILRDALAQGASDVYCLPGRETLRIRFKIDGREKCVAEVASDFGEQCIARVKVMAGLLTYRSNIAQDGAVHGVRDDDRAELRIATMPTAYGERVTVRIMNRGQIPQRLEELGFTDDVLQALRCMASRPTGMLVLTGPTGSGKTTTIYALIRELLEQGEDPASVITIEDPIETVIDGISQVQVTRSDAEWGYAPALRAALRHDVKTLAIGEMRDREVVHVALDAALTGHRVITTYHAGDIAAVYARLLHQGFEPFLIAAAVSGVLSQRLLQKRDGAGRIPVAAVLNATDEWRDFITANPGLGQLRKQATTIPGADLQAVAADMAERGLIHRKDVFLL